MEEKLKGWIKRLLRRHKYTLQIYVEDGILYYETDGKKEQIGIDVLCGALGSPFVNFLLFNIKSEKVEYTTSVEGTDGERPEITITTRSIPSEKSEGNSSWRLEDD